MDQPSVRACLHSLLLKHTPPKVVDLTRRLRGGEGSRVSSVHVTPPSRMLIYVVLVACVHVSTRRSSQLNARQGVEIKGDRVTAVVSVLLQQVHGGE